MTCAGPQSSNTLSRAFAARLACLGEFGGGPLGQSRLCAPQVVGRARETGQRKVLVIDKIKRHNAVNMGNPVSNRCCRREVLQGDNRPSKHLRYEHHSAHLVSSSLFSVIDGQ